MGRLVHRLVAGFSYTVELAPVYIEWVPSSNIYRNMVYSETFSGFPQSLPQIQINPQSITTMSFITQS